MTHDQYPQTPEEQPFAHQKLRQYNDGDAVFIYDTPGIRTPLGATSPNRYATDFCGSHMALITTDAGDTYGVARGLVLNGPQNWAWITPDDTFDITIGESCVLPGVGMTAPVVSVMLHYKDFPVNALWHDFRVDTPSPFKQLEADAMAVYEEHMWQ